jgi:hypothetical protein
MKAQDVIDLVGSIDEGKSTTPKYVIAFTKVFGGVRMQHTPMSWDKQYGKPTAKNLEAFIRKHNQSLKPGGVNAHLGSKSLVLAAAIRHNKVGGSDVATWKDPKPPMFVSW